MVEGLWSDEHREPTEPGSGHDTPGYGSVGGAEQVATVASGNRIGGLKGSGIWYQSRGHLRERLRAIRTTARLSTEGL